jgi:hypothetical protein
MTPFAEALARTYTRRGMAEEGDAASEATIGSLALEEGDLLPAIIDMSVWSRGRFGIALIIALAYGTLALRGHVTTADVAPQVMIGGIFLFFVFASPRIRARRLLESIAAGGDRHASYRFDDDGVTFRTAGSTNVTSYRSLVEYQEARTAFLVYSSPGVAHVVPKRAFSPEGMARVGALLAAHVKKRRQRSANKLILAWSAGLLLFFVVWQFLNASSPPTP